MWGSMKKSQLNWITGYIWGIADDVLRDLYVRGKYRDVILPMTVLRRLDAVLEDSKQAVLDRKALLDKAGVVEQDPALRQAAGQAFYNTSRFTMRGLMARAGRQQLKADFEAYLDGFSPNVQDILENFDFRNQIPRLSKADALGTLIAKLTSPEINLSPEPVKNSDGSTKHAGLDPDVPLKDSGVEWLGEVPEHWEVRRNGRLFAQRNETGFADLPILGVSLRTGVRIRDFDNSDRKQVMSDRDKYKRALAGDIAYNMMRMWQGAVGIVPVDGLVSPAYVVARPLPGTEARYFEQLFRIPVYMQGVDNYSRGIVKDRNRLYWEDFKALPTCYPPAEEQTAIVEHLDKATTSINTTITRTNREISLLNEYRTRLIADVVTGKLDVRGAVAVLPEVDPLGTQDDLEDVLEPDSEAALVPSTCSTTTTTNASGRHPPGVM